MKQVNFTVKLINEIKSFGWKFLGLSVLLLSLSSWGLSQNIQWERNLGGNGPDFAKSIVQTSDDGFAITGYVFSHGVDVGGNNGDGDYWIVKLNNAGAFQWETNLGGSGEDVAKSIVQTSDDGYAIVGETKSSDGDVEENNGFFDYWVIKLDKTGTIQWEKNLGGSDSDYANSIVQTFDGGFAIAGYSHSSDGDVGGNNGEEDYWVVKLDNTGAIQWETNMGGNGEDIARSIVQTSDGGYAIAGESRSSDSDVGGNNGFNDYWVVKLDNTGAIQWEKNFGGRSNDVARSIVQTSDDGFAIAGESYSSDGDVGGNNGNFDYWIIKLDKTGAIQWEKNLGGSKDDKARSIAQSSDGGFTIAGFTSSSDGDVGGNNGNFDYWVVKLDNSGVIQWEKNLGGSKDDFGNSIVRASDGSFALAGESESSDGDVGGNNGDDDYWVVKLGIDNQTGMVQNNQNAFFSIYPNPVQDQLKLQTQTQAQTYTIHTLTGQKAQSGKLSGKGTHTLDVSNLSPGVYLLQVQGEDAVRTKKVVVE